MKLLWFPAWACQNYTFGQSYGRRCPYCPYSLDKNTNRLIYDNRVAGSDARASAADLIAFFNANHAIAGGHIEVSGGEALMRQDLPDILAAIPHTWAITSNTLMHSVVDQLIERGLLGRCRAWTASWHPHSGMEKSYERNVRAIAAVNRHVRATVVISSHTIDLLSETLRFLGALPLAGINWHLDAHQVEDGAQLKARADAIIGPGAVYLAGQPPQGKLCNRHEHLMAVGPDGSLYQCATFAYQDIDPICKVNGDVLLSNLPQRIEWCDALCFACCDHVKHQK